MNLFERMQDLFGLKVNKDLKTKNKVLNVNSNDGAIDIEGGAVGFASTFYHTDIGVSATENANIMLYRQLAQNSEIDFAVNEITNESFIFEDDGNLAVSLEFRENSEFSEELQDKIRQEFKYLYQLLRFEKNGSTLFKQWYIDSKIYLYKIIDDDNPLEGIKQIQWIDPIQIKKIRILPRRDSLDPTISTDEIEEFYVYSSSDKTYTKELKINPDAITYVTSGLFDHEQQITVGYLGKAVVPYNNLKLMEDALIVYRVTRSPERRVFYVDTGGLPPSKAEQYLNDLMNRLKNKMVFDSKTGTIMDRRNVMSMVEDFFLARSNGRGTEIQTLPGSQNVGVIDDITYFKEKLYKSINIPLGRIRDEQPSGFMYGKGVEIDREEYRFKKFLNKLRRQFSEIFFDILRTQLLLKKIITDDEWDYVRNNIYLKYLEDNAFVEFKNSEIFNNRIQTLGSVDAFVGKYFTPEWVMKNVLNFSQEEITTMQENLSNSSENTDESGGESDENYEEETD